MQARTNQTHSLSTMDNFESPSGGRKSIGALVREWGPCVLTAIVVPGGIVIALLLLWTRWNQKRQAVQNVSLQIPTPTLTGRL